MTICMYVYCLNKSVLSGILLLSYLFMKWISISFFCVASIYPVVCSYRRYFIFFLLMVWYLIMYAKRQRTHILYGGLALCILFRCISVWMFMCIYVCVYVCVGTLSRTDTCREWNEFYVHMTMPLWDINIWMCVCKIYGSGWNVYFMMLDIHIFLHILMYKIALFHFARWLKWRLLLELFIVDMRIYAGKW